jgi:3-isopropylmalate dehydrogenase
MKTFQIAVFPGDGVGGEVTAEAVRALQTVAGRFRFGVRFDEATIGGAAIDQHGTALPVEALQLAKAADAVLLGAVGGPKWDNPEAAVRPEQALLGLRKGLGLYANLRPVKLIPALVDSSTIKPEILEGVDLVVVRELTGGIYFGKPSRVWETARGRKGVDTLVYSESEIERIVRVGFELARGRRRRLTSVDKANILSSSRLWRSVAARVAQDYPDVQLDHLLVDACAMHLIRRPASFDVIVTENLFGDILTDEASMLAGSMGMLPSASLGAPKARRGVRPGLYEPIHGTAPDIAGQGKANPIASILSAAMMLENSFGLAEPARAIEAAVEAVLGEGCRTQDIAGPGERAISTREMGDRIIERLAA